jgi:ATPase subunit of ABC transporter with duplicated ATPase domains
MDALGAWELEGQARAALAEVGIPDPGMRVGAMSGGQRRKVAVAAALLGAADVVILDEPTNHMDVQVRAACCVVCRRLCPSACASRAHARHLAP